MLEEALEEEEALMLTQYLSYSRYRRHQIFLNFSRTKPGVFIRFLNNTLILQNSLEEALMLTH